MWWLTWRAPLHHAVRDAASPVHYAACDVASTDWRRWQQRRASGLNLIVVLCAEEVEVYQPASAHGGQGGSLVPPHTRRGLSLYLSLYQPAGAGGSQARGGGNAGCGAGGCAGVGRGESSCGGGKERAGVCSGDGSGGGGVGVRDAGLTLRCGAAAAAAAVAVATAGAAAAVATLIMSHWMMRVSLTMYPIEGVVDIMSSRTVRLSAWMSPKALGAPALKVWDVGPPTTRGLHSSTFCLNVSALCGIGGALRG